MNLYHVDNNIHPYTDHVNNLHDKRGAPCGTCRRYRMGAAPVGCGIHRYLRWNTALIFVCYSEISGFSSKSSIVQPRTLDSL